MTSDVAAAPTGRNDALDDRTTRTSGRVILRDVTRRLHAAAICGVFAALAFPAAAQAAPGPYVAVGDSYTAAAGIPDVVGEPTWCLRSDHNYPSIVAAATGVTQFRDRSCSGATTEHMTTPENVVPVGVNAPQFDALDPDTALVTIGIGGNDVRLVEAVFTCVQLGLLAPIGSACRSRFGNPDGGDRIVDQIGAAAPKIAAALQGVHARAPQARVLIVGYPAFLPRGGRGCYPLVPLSSDDLLYLDEMLRRTNAMLAEQAAANDAEYVDTYDDSVGHDMCTVPRTRWFEGVVPASPTLPIHPNARGELSMAHSVLRVLAQPQTAR
jgi:lysophospholipase L1-like esterase